MTEEIWIIWTEVHNILYDAVMKIIPNKKKYKKVKGLSEEILQ